jgi:ATPase subunit of ABC transporter with duplicated ATPase domains
VLGVNGSGKSTLLRIMAGLDKEYNGEAWVAEGARVGYLEQEPQLDPPKRCARTSCWASPQKAILDRYNELAMNYSDETADEMTKLQDEIEAAGLWDLDSKVDQAMDALRCPPDDADVTKLSGGERAASRCASCCSTSPTCCCWTSRPTISTPSRCHGWKAICAISRRDPDRHP